MSKQDTTVTMTTEVEAPETTKFQHTWVLWYFDPRNKDWTLSNYKRVADLSTPQQLWTVVSAIPKEAMECGYFFFMRKGFRPIWEVPENENGNGGIKGKRPSKKDKLRQLAAAQKQLAP